MEVESSATLRLDVYPNPASEYLTIESERSIQALRLVQIDGKIVYEFSPKNSTNSVQISVEKLPNGVYLLQAQTEAGMITRRVIVQK